MGTAWGLLVLLLLASGYAWQKWYNPDARIRRALARVPVTRIAEFRDGQVGKIGGTLEYTVALPLHAPFTLRPCAYFHVTVEEKSQNGWSRIVSQERAQDFIVRDRDGTRALVRMDLARVSARPNATFESGLTRDPPPTLETFMAAHGRPTRGLLFNKHLRYRECVLEADQEVTVGGLGRWEPDPNPGSVGGAYREAPRRLVMTGSEKLLLLVSDEIPALVSS